MLKRILEDATALDNRTNVDVQLNAYLECLAATLLASDPATITKIQTSISVGRNLDYLTASIKLLSTAAQNQLSSLFLLMLQFLQVYQARTTLSSGGQQDQAIGKEISMCRNLLANMTSTAAAVPYPFELAHKLLNSLERTYDPISYRRNSFLRPATFPSLPVEIELLLHSILYHQCQDAPSIFAGSIAARLAVQQAISANKDLDSAQEVLNFWCADLFSCCFRHAPMPDQPRSRTEARWRALVFGYLPTMLLDLKNHPSLRDAALDWSAAFEAGMSKGNGDSHQSGEALPGDWTSEMMDYISSAKRAVREIDLVSCKMCLTCVAGCTILRLFCR